MPWWLPAAVKGVKTGLQYAFRPERSVTTPPFEETPYGGLLRKRSRVGIPTQVRGGLLRGFGRRTGNIAQQERARIGGGLIPRGMYGSISGLRALGEPGRQRMGLIGEYGKELDIKSELAKWGAEEELARLSTEWRMRREAEEEQRRLQESQAKWGLLGGLAQTGMGLYGGLMSERLAKLEAPEGEEYGPYAPYVFAQQGGIRLPYYAGREQGLNVEDISKMSDDEFLRYLNIMYGGGE